MPAPPTQYSYQSADLVQRFEAVRRNDPEPDAAAQESKEEGKQAKAPKAKAAKAKATAATKLAASKAAKAKAKAKATAAAKQVSNRKTKAVSAPKQTRKKRSAPPVVETTSSSSSTSSSSTSSAGRPGLEVESPGPDEMMTESTSTLEPVPTEACSFVAVCNMLFVKSLRV